MTGNISGLLTGLRDAAADDLFDDGGIDAGSLYGRTLDLPEQDSGVQPAQPALAGFAPADGRTLRFDDDGFSH